MFRMSAISAVDPLTVKSRALLAALFVLGLCTFAPSLRFDFVNWDDPAYVHHNDAIKGWTPKHLYGVATETVTRNYAPLTIFSFLLDYSWTGMDPTGYHATNILLHAVNGVLVCMLISQLTGSWGVGWLSAALFLVHPVQIESVVWISSRKGLLSASFMLLALLIRLRPDAQLRHDGWYILCLAAALLSKALAVVLPPIVLFYDILIRREKTADAVVRQLIPGLMSLMLLMYTMGAQNSILGGVRSHMDLSLPHILAVDVVILWQYIGMLFAPAALSVLYDPAVSGIALKVIAGLTGWLLLAFPVWKYREQQPLWLFGWLTFFLLLFPVLNFFRITTLMNDRYLYLPCICIFAMTLSALRFAVEKIRTSQGGRLSTVTPLVTGGIAVAVIAGCILRTNSHMPVWKNAESLWNHAMVTVPHLAVVRIQMALNLHDTGRIQEAVDVLRLAQTQCVADEADQQRIARYIGDWTTELSRVASAASSEEALTRLSPAAPEKRMD